MVWQDYLTHYWTLEEDVGVDKEDKVGTWTLQPDEDSGYTETVGTGLQGQCPDYEDTWVPSWDNRGVGYETKDLVPIIAAKSFSIGIWTRFGTNCWDGAYTGVHMCGMYNSYSGSSGTFRLMNSGGGGNANYCKPGLWTINDSRAVHNVITSIDYESTYENNWTLTIATYDETSKEKNIWINTTNVATATATGSVGYGGSTGRFYIGGATTSSWNWSIGNINGYRMPAKYFGCFVIEDYIMTLSDITWLYNGGLARSWAEISGGGPPVIAPAAFYIH